MFRNIKLGGADLFSVVLWGPPNEARTRVHLAMRQRFAGSGQIITLDGNFESGSLHKNCIVDADLVLLSASHHAHKVVSNVQKILATAAKIPVILYIENDADHHTAVVAGIRAGAHGYIKCGHQTWAEHTAVTELTADELQVLTLLAQGRTNKKIAETTGLSEHNLKITLLRIKWRLNARDQAHAVAIYLRSGLPLSPQMTPTIPGTPHPSPQHSNGDATAQSDRVCNESRRK